MPAGRWEGRVGGGGNARFTGAVDAGAGADSDAGRWDVGAAAAGSVEVRSGSVEPAATDERRDGDPIWTSGSLSVMAHCLDDASVDR